MSEPKSIFDVEPDEPLEARLDDEAEAACAAGRRIPHEQVIEWLKLWRTINELPFPTA